MMSDFPAIREAMRRGYLIHAIDGPNYARFEYRGGKYLTASGYYYDEYDSDGAYAEHDTLDAAIAWLGGDDLVILEEEAADLIAKAGDSDR